MPTDPPVRGKPDLLTIVCPAYNERDVLAEFHHRMVTALEAMAQRYEIVYVDDGSRDGTAELLDQLYQSGDGITVVTLSRNFGKETAIIAGLDNANGDAAVIIDADLQHPPELIADFIEGWREGYDVVYGQRASRDDEPLFKRKLASLFYRMIAHTGPVKLPRDAGDFRLVSRRVLLALRSLRESHRFMKGLFAWVGFPSKAVVYRPDRRFAGRSKWNYSKLWTLSIEGITSFTTFPLKLSSYFGFFVSASAFLYAAFVFVKTIIYGEPVRGFATLLIVVLFLGGVQLVALGIIGEYLGRIFNETKGRPLYIAQEIKRPTSEEPR